MSIVSYFKDEVVIRRLRDVDSTQRAVSATATADCCIQALGKEARQRMGIVSARAWIAWFRIDSVVQEGDKLTDQDGNEFLVSEVTIKDYGINQHKEVILLEYNA